MNRAWFIKFSYTILYHVIHDSCRIHLIFIHDPGLLHVWFVQVPFIFHPWLIYVSCMIRICAMYGSCMFHTWKVHFFIYESGHFLTHFMFKSLHDISCMNRTLIFVCNSYMIVQHGYGVSYAVWPLKIVVIRFQKHQIVVKRRMTA